MILLRKLFFDSNSTKYKDSKELATGIASGAILGPTAYKYVDKQLNTKYLKDYLESHLEKTDKLYKSLGKKKFKRVLNELTSTMTPETIKGMKKSSLIGAGVGGVITGADLIIKNRHQNKNKKENNKLPKVKSFSQVAEDWNENDDRYVKLVENAKKRQKFLVKYGKPNTIYATVGAGIGAISGYRSGKLYKSINNGNKAAQKLIGKASILDRHPILLRTAGNTMIGSSVGYSISNLGNHMTSIATNGKYLASDPERLEKMAKNERKAADRIVSKYKKMKTAKEREEFRKKIGVKF